MNIISTKAKDEFLIKMSKLEAKISEFEKSKLHSSNWLQNSLVRVKIVYLNFNLQFRSNWNLSTQN